MITRQKTLITFVLLTCVSAAMASTSGLVVITPDNEAEHPFRVQAQTVGSQRDRSRVRIFGAPRGGQRAWLIVCKTHVHAERQDFRHVLWSDSWNANIERYIQLFPEQAASPEMDSKLSSYVEVELSHEQMRRAYIYIDYPRPVDDGGAYYSIDLAYYLDGRLGKKREIQWGAP